MQEEEDSQRSSEPLLYSLVIVGVLVVIAAGTWYWQHSSTPAEPTATSAPSPTPPQSVPTTTTADSTNATEAENAAALAAEQAEFNKRQLAAPRFTTESAANPNVAAEPTVERETTIIISGALLEEIEAAAAAAAPIGLNPADTPQLTVTTDTALDVSYRQSQDSWLAELRRLTQELGTLTQQADTTDAYFAALSRQWREEQRFFKAQFPDVDLTATLTQ
jgi:hypothetical protein